MGSVKALFSSSIMVMFEDLDVPFSPGVAKLRTERINTKYLPGLKSDATHSPIPDSARVPIYTSENELLKKRKKRLTVV